MLYTQWIKAFFRFFKYTPVINKLIPSFVRRWHLCIDKRYHVSNLQNCQWLIDVQEYSGRRMASWGDFEHEQFDFLKQEIDRIQPDIFLDIGSFNAYYAIRIANEYPNISVHAFEPNPKNRMQLCANIFLNDMVNRITLHDVALGDCHEETTIGFETLRNRGGSQIGERGIVEQYQIKVVPSDDIIKIKNQKIVMKIDTEGYEEKVLNGMTELIKNNQCFMQIECWDDNQTEFKKQLDRLGLDIKHKIFWDLYVQNFN